MADPPFSKGGIGKIINTEELCYLAFMFPWEVVAPNLHLSVEAVKDDETHSLEGDPKLVGGQE